MNKIVLGTAQFGLDYGINNQRGKIPSAEASAILTEAVKFGINTVDTAYVYGESEAVLGAFLQANKNSGLRAISKLPACRAAEVEKIFLNSLKRLGADKIFGYLIHGFADYQSDPEIWEALRRIKKAGKAEKIGFSLYYPAELATILKDGLNPDMVQIPLSIFDQRFEPYLAELKKRKIEVYARSVFLQGLAFKDPQDLDRQFAGIKDNLQQLRLCAKQNGIPLFALCLNFVAGNQLIDKVVVGVDNLAHLREIMHSADYASQAMKLNLGLRQLKVEDEEILLPFKWNTEKGRV